MEDKISFNQSKYIKKMLKKFGLQDSKPTKTPMSTEIKLTKDDEAESVDSTKYREFNLAYYIAHKIENVKNRVDCPLPYGLLLTRLYKYILARHPKLFHPHSKLQFILHYRMMNSINGKNGKKKAKDKETKPTISHSPSSKESTNQSTSLLGSYQQELLANE
ncbi:hypothetical protein Tco_0104385 [Tanacetum coccineum]